MFLDQSDKNDLFLMAKDRQLTMLLPTTYILIGYSPELRSDLSFTFAEIRDRFQHTTYQIRIAN